MIGTSAGSIVALLVAAGYDAEQCKQAINERAADGKSRFASFLEVPRIPEDADLHNSLRYWLRTELDNPAVPNLIEPVVDSMVEGLIKADLARHLVSLFAWGGWYSGNNLLNYLRDKLEICSSDLGDSTLAEFTRHTGRDLSVVATDVTNRTMLVLNARTAPNCPTAWAVRMSMSCPLVWQEVVWRREWGLYRGNDISGHKIVDGGLLSNFPIRLFISQDELAEAIMGENPETDDVIGMLLDDGLLVPGAEDTHKVDSGAPGFLERSDLVGEMMLRISGMADTLLSGHDKEVIDAYQHLVCRLPAGGYGMLEFDLTPERMTPILAAGEAAMEAHLAARMARAAALQEHKPAVIS